MKLGICKFWKIQNESKLQVFLAWGKKKKDNTFKETLQIVKISEF